MIGPAIPIPWGLVVYIAILAVVMMIIAEICWRVMDHLPEDDIVVDDEHRFRLQKDDD